MMGRTKGMLLNLRDFFRRETSLVLVVLLGIASGVLFWPNEEDFISIETMEYGVCWG
jgi:hypothetical protein